MRSIIKRESAYKTNYERASDQILDGCKVMKLCYRINHDPYSSDAYRCASYMATRSILDEFAEFIDTEQIFPSSEQELNQKIFQYESYVLNQLNSFGGIPKISLAEKRGQMLEIIGGIQGPVKNLYSSERTFGWFAMHLNAIVACLHFLASKYDAIILFEDDIKVSNRIYSELIDLESYLDLHNFDFFNFVVPSDSKTSFRTNLRMGDTHISQTYQCWPGAAILGTRSGVKKLLEVFFSPSSNDVNDLRPFDTIIHNVSLWLIDEYRRGWHRDDSQSRAFKSFTFIPDHPSIVEWRMGHSTYC